MIFRYVTIIREKQTIGNANPHTKVLGDLPDDLMNYVLNYQFARSGGGAYNLINAMGERGFRYIAAEKGDFAGKEVMAYMFEDCSYGSEPPHVTAVLAVINNLLDMMSTNRNLTRIQDVRRQLRHTSGYINELTRNPNAVLRIFVNLGERDRNMLERIIQNVERDTGYRVNVEFIM
jgi:hypothetical protein